MKRFIAAFATASLVALCSACAVAPVLTAEPQTPQSAPASGETKPVQFSRLATKLPLGESIGQLQYGWACFPGRQLGWRGGRLNITDEELKDTFRKEFEAQRYRVVGDPYALFGDPAAAEAEIVVGGVADKVEIKACFPFSGSPNVDIGNTSTLKGGAYMRIAWQVYSRRDGKVVYQTTTEGSFRSEELLSGGLALVLRNAFAANVRHLLADRGFRELLVPTPTPNEKAPGAAT